MNFNGTHYKVYYPEDGDEESLSEYELDALDIVDGSEDEAEESSDDDKDDDDSSSIESFQPKFPIGTRFIKVCMK